MPVVSQFKLFINRLFRQLKRVIGKGWKPKTICELSIGYKPKIEKGPGIGALDMPDLYEEYKKKIDVFVKSHPEIKPVSSEWSAICKKEGERHYIGDLMVGKGDLVERITQEDIDLAFIGDSKELVTHIVGQNP